MEQKKVAILCTFTIIFLNSFILSSAVILEIEDGKLLGTVMTTRKNINFHAFLNIPYAEPPVGNLRFQPPVPKREWDGIRNATEHGPMCMQVKRYFPVSEDCLYLNVYSRNVGAVMLKPVIVFVHGGSFEEGTARNHQPLYLMDRDVVLVTINFRVGPFGFLSTGTTDATGNQSLKDQVLALKWIQKNIVRFGGDPQRVTIAGLSSGGYSVTALMASDMAKGLFRRVIAISGAITAFGKLEDNNLHLASYIADKVNCTTSNITDMVRCLKEKAADAIMAVDVRPATNCKYGVSWLPVIEKDFGQERLLNQHPFEVFSDPKTAPKVQVMIGITEHEMYYLVPTVLNDTKFIKQVKENLFSTAAACFYLEKYSTNSDLFRHIYFPYDDIDLRSFNNIGNLFSDGSIGYGAHRLVHMISKCTDVYYYKFTYVGRHSVFKYPRQFPFGAIHSDDLQYTLNTAYIGSNIELTDPENIMVERMTRIWEQFAATGNPNNANDLYLKDMIWPKHDEDEYYLEIGTHFVEKQGLFLERFKAFDDLINNSSAKVKTFSILFSLVFIVMRLC